MVRGTFLSSSCISVKSEPIADFLESTKPICNRVTRFLASTRESLYETETEEMTPSWRLPLLITTSNREIRAVARFHPLLIDLLLFQRRKSGPFFLHYILAMNQEWNPPKTYVYGPRVVHDHHHDELPDYLSRLSLGGEPKTYPVKKFVLEQGSIDKVRLDKLKSLLLENLYEGEGQSGNLYKWDDLKTILEATDEELDSALFLLGIVKAAFVAIGCNALTSHTYKIGKGENLKKCQLSNFHRHFQLSHTSFLQQICYFH
ncbi:hypothetical protein L1987_75676 [Smallanthus sonchifolius]|uniref:Uncharacterized protein n=1 Tax=Smallanthus sonchifolius TaxID=185202 RepID=A0ACB9A644_9ASTR|nr:hypothetical protein L1987_75676 [Smallanthus sonchifolius]